jgi:transcriptional regulator with XRE-family HTH domain
MKDRIKKYMDYKSISAGELSSRLDVQRSNISHILNGRNKPGASFIEKLLVNFPDLNARWLFTGNGEMVENIDYNGEGVDSGAKSISVNESANKVVNKHQLTNSPVTGDDKPIDKIVILFSDGTFTDFKKIKYK